MKKNLLPILAVLIFGACNSSEKYGNRQESEVLFYTSATPKEATAKVLATFSQNGWRVGINRYYDFDGSTSLVLQKGNYCVAFNAHSGGLVKIYITTQEKLNDRILWIVDGKIRETVLNLVKTCLDERVKKCELTKKLSIQMVAVSVITGSNGTNGLMAFVFSKIKPALKIACLCRPNL